MNYQNGQHRMRMKNNTEHHVNATIQNMERTG